MFRYIRLPVCKGNAWTENCWRKFQDVRLFHDFQQGWDCFVVFPRDVSVFYTIRQRLDKKCDFTGEYLFTFMKSAVILRGTYRHAHRLSEAVWRHTYPFVSEFIREVFELKKRYSIFVTTILSVNLSSGFVNQILFQWRLIKMVPHLDKNVHKYLQGFPVQWHQSLDLKCCFLGRSRRITALFRQNMITPQPHMWYLAYLWTLPSKII